MYDVEPEKFVYKDDVHFMRYVIDDKVAGNCKFIKQEVTCTDDPVDDRAKTTAQESPSAVIISTKGVSRGVYERLRNPSGYLVPGQQVVYQDVTCAIPDDSHMKCTVGDKSLIISGKDGRVSTTGPSTTPKPKAAPTTAAQKSNSDSGLEVDYNKLAQIGETCGALTGEPGVKLESGEISCREALDVLAYYRAIRHARGDGQSLLVEFNGWGCSSLPAVRAKQTGGATVCEKQLGKIRLVGD